MSEIGIVGASGFVGSAVSTSLQDAGVSVRPIRAPRLSIADEHALFQSESENEQEISALAGEIAGCDAVINCAGDPNASSQDRNKLLGANALLPGVIGAAARSAAVSRFVHVSSAVVQGRAKVLDSSMNFDAFSTYARSKMLGELEARRLGPSETSVYRPPSVHAPSRRVTRGVTWLATSPLSSVASPADSPTPQALIANVADAVRFLATTDKALPPVVHHPSEHLTTSLLLELLGDRQPKELPRGFARLVVRLLELTAHAITPLAPHARRIDMMWFGQMQAESWLEEQEWRPVAGLDAWKSLGQMMRNKEGN